MRLHLLAGNANPACCPRIRAAHVLGLVAVMAASGANAQQLATRRVSPDAKVLGAGVDELFQAVRFGRFFPDGRVVLADAGNLFLRVYGADGKRLADMGNPGAGPGEFRAIHGVWVTSESKIGVWDGQIRRFTLFESDGSIVATHPARARDPSRATVEAFLGAFDDGSVLLASLRMEGRARPAEALPERWFLGRFSHEGELIGVAGELEGMWRTTHGPLPFSPVPQVVVLKDSIWTSTGFDDRIAVRNSEGQVIRRVDLPWTATPSADPRQALEERLRQDDKSLFLIIFDESEGITGYPYVAGIIVDDRGHLWIKEYDPLIDSLWLKRNALAIAPGGTWRILRSDGAWLAAVRMPDNLIPLDIRGSSLLAVELDAMDVERVVIRRIMR
jgi:hypothetical protein